MGNRNLHRAKRAKKDEFYTRYEDIWKEMQHYWDHFRGKVIYCNCDDPFESDFFRYFALNFNFLGLEKLIAVSYAGSPVAGEKLPLVEIGGLRELKDGQGFKVEITEGLDVNQDDAWNYTDVELLLRHDANAAAPLESDGDFRSEECIELLKEADVVVTNPPFSLFREYVAQLMEYEKDFLIIGSFNAVTYKEIFPLIKDNKIWLGVHNGAKTYRVPDDFDRKNTFVGDDGYKYAKMGNTCWYTNLDVYKRHEDIKLYRRYSPELYPKYDNYDAIEVGRVAQIPMDYDGVMGVPITFIDKYNPEQFEIVKFRNCTRHKCSRGIHKALHTRR